MSTENTVKKERLYLTGLWKHTFADGSSVIQANVSDKKADEIKELINGLVTGDSIKIFKNNRKENDSQPDYNLLIEKAPLAQAEVSSNSGEF